MNNEAQLLYSAPDQDADMLYLGQFQAPDAFLAIKFRGKSYAFMNSLEFGRAIKESTFDNILSLDEWKEKLVTLKKAFNNIELIKCFAKEFNVSTFVIPENFPAGLAFQLKKARVKLNVKETPFFPERMCKNDIQAEAIKAGNKLSALGFKRTRKILEKSTIKKGVLYYKKKVLTSEFIKQEIDTICLEKGASAKGTIVACGDQACDPHDSGTGPIYANQLIIVDIFPRVEKTGYFGDMTRTFLKGKASKEQKKLMNAVRECQKHVLENIRPRQSCQKIHQLAVDYFEANGFKTGRDGDGYKGFFHGTGHGLGLDIHERPNLGSRGGNDLLKTGMTVTVEPGLYYKGIGGVRIEDVVRVTPKGYERLSSSPYKWEIK